MASTTTTMSKIKDNPNPEPAVDFSLTISQATSFLTPNGIDSHPKFEFSDIELISLHSLTYTSLKDILPTNRSPPAIMSPASNSSWYEIPIKNHLVKQAALAYLQPMSIPQESDDRGLFSKLKDKCCCGGGSGFGCLAFFREVVRIIKHAFRERRNEFDDYDDDEDYESDDYDDDEEDDKVD